MLVSCFFVSHPFEDLLESIFEPLLGLWIVFALFFSIIAASAGHFNKHAEGSGIPELKSILAGVYIYKYLSLKTLICKVFGLFGALCAGFPIGKEGPYVHISACISNKLAKIKYFEDISTDNILK